MACYLDLAHLALYPEDIRIRFERGRGVLWYTVPHGHRTKYHEDVNPTATVQNTMVQRMFRVRGSPA